MIYSTEKEYKDKISQLKQEKEIIGTMVLHQCTRIINTADFITPEQRDKLVKMIWEGRMAE